MSDPLYTMNMPKSQKSLRLTKSVARKSTGYIIVPKKPQMVAVEPTVMSWWIRALRGCLFGCDYPLWSRLSEHRMALECPRCGNQEVINCLDSRKE